MASTAALLLLLSPLIHSQHIQSDAEFWKSLGREHIARRTQWKKPTEKGPKNIIVFIGDGMGLSMVTAGRAIHAEKTGTKYKNTPWSFENMDFTAIVKTSSFDYFTTDSAASATALFTGHKVEQDTLGRLPGHGDSCHDGEEAFIRDGIAELAVARGLDVGIVTTTKLTDATPAANYAKGVNRYMEHNNSTRIRGTACIDIAQQIVMNPGNKFKVLMGGGHAYFTPTQQGGYRTDGRNIEKEWLALGGKRTLLRNLSHLHSHVVEADEHVIGVFTDRSFGYRLDDVVDGVQRQPRLVEMATKAVQVLQASNNDNGWFLMVEGGHIDLAEHDNKMHLAAEELAEFSSTIETIRAMVDEDTLIIVTADHGHALTLPGYTHINNSIFAGEPLDPFYESDGFSIPNIHFAAGPGSNTSRNYSKEEMESIHFAHPATYHSRWGVHGAEDVGLWAHGPYSWLFTGTFENTNVAYLIKYLLCIDPTESSLCTHQEEYEVTTSSSAQESPRREESWTLIVIVGLGVVAAFSSTSSLLLLLFLCRRRSPLLSSVVDVEQRK